MNVEDSYEGAVRRLRRLGHAGIDLARQQPALAQERDEANERLRDLEELATLACEDNERLTRDLDLANGENARLQRLVATLQETLTNAQSDELFAAPKKSGRGFAFYFFTLVILGGGGAALFVLRPWEHLQSAAAAAALTTPVVTAPVVTAPVVQPSAPVVAAPAPVVPKVEPVLAPKLEPVVPKVVAATRPSEPVRVAAPTRSRSQHRHSAKHHPAKSSRRDDSKHGSAARSSNKSSVPDTDDPLGGVNL